jgi:hypothetical protein
MNSTPGAAPTLVQHDTAQVIDVASKPIRAVHDNGITFSRVLKRRLQLRPLRVLAGGRVAKHAVCVEVL